MFAIGDFASAASGETPEQAKARRDGRRFMLDTWQKGDDKVTPIKYKAAA